MKTMVTTCSALGCRERASKGNTVTFHRFPTRPELRDKWIKAIKRKNFEPTRNARICEKHFTPDAYLHCGNRKKLRHDAIPELFDFSKFVANRHALEPKWDLAHLERIQNIQFVDVNSTQKNSLPSYSSPTVIVIGQVNPTPVPINSVNRVDSDPLTPSVSVPRISSSFSLIKPTQNIEKSGLGRSSISEVAVSSLERIQNIKILGSVSPGTSDVAGNQNIEKSGSSSNIPTMQPNVWRCKKFVNKFIRIKRKFIQRSIVMNRVHTQLKKRTTFLENLLIRIKEKQLTGENDVTDLIDCFMVEETEESDEDSSTGSDEYDNILSRIDNKISHLQKFINENETPEENRRLSGNKRLSKNRKSPDHENEGYGKHIESLIKNMNKGEATYVMFQIGRLLKEQETRLVVSEFPKVNVAFSGLENIEINENHD